MNAPLTQKFDYLPGMSLRALVRDGNPWFVAKDVCVVLGYRNGPGTVKDHVQEADKGIAICSTLGGAQSLTVINESGLYALVLKSYKVEARAFQQWVTREV